jgi:hypothetical protein
MRDSNFDICFLERLRLELNNLQVTLVVIGLGSNKT